MSAFFTTVKAVALAAYAILVLLTLRSSTAPRLKWSFFLYLTGMALWQLTSLGVSLAKSPEAALFWYNLLLSSSGLYNVFFFPFTRSFLGIRRQKVWTAAAYAAAAVIAASGLIGVRFNAVRIGGGGYYVPELNDPSLYVVGILSLFFVGAGVVNLIRGLVTERSPFQRNRITYVLLGACVVIAGAVSNLTRLRDYPVDIACNLVSALIFAYAVVRHRLLDFRVVLVRSLFYSILTGVVVLLYLVSVMGFQMLLADRLSLDASSYYSVLALLALAVVFLPVRNVLQRGLDRLFFRRRYDYQKVMESFSRSVSSARESGRILDLVISAVHETIKVERLFITLWDPGTSCYVPESADGIALDALPRCAMRENHALVRWLRREGTPLLWEETSVRPELAALREESREIFERTDTTAVIPILSAGRLSGVIHVGSKRSGAIFNEEDLRFLTTMANQAATALDNAFVYREIERRLAEQTLLFVLSETFRRRIGFEMVLQSATEVLRDFLNVDHCLIGSLMGDRVAVYSAGKAGEEVRPVLERGFAAYLAGAVAAPPPASESQEILDLAGAIRRAGGAEEADLRLLDRYECYPLRRANELLGLFLIPVPASPSEDRRDLVRTVTSILSQGMMLNRSISELQEMKSYNDSIINSMASSVVVVDADLRVTTVNRAARRFAGLGEDDQAGSLLGRPLGEVRILGQLSDLVGDALRRGRTYQSRETMVTLSGQKSIPIGISTSVLSIDDQPRGVVVIFTDLSEIKQLENQLLRSEKLASIGRLAAGVSHELRNPLGSIAGYAELIQERIRTDDEVITRGLATIVGESERSRKIIESLLDYARVKEPHFDVVELRRVIDDTVPLVERQLAHQRIRLERDYRDEGALVRADREQIREVFINLLLNAQQATEGEGKSISLSTGVEKGRVLVTVTDQGCGIPAENLNKLFDPFFTTKADGTGLGLSIVHRIVEDHRGLIYVDSTPGTGSRFTVSLPIVDAPDGAAGA